MQPDSFDDFTSSPPTVGHHLPALAPRQSTATSISARDRTSRTTSARPARLSHRSRAGCWTCRGRKVKCDEQHPRCGPCVRLNRECDWDHRWNFSDATPSTQTKHSNVSTIGSAVWDPSVRSSRSTSASPLNNDHLPAFAALTNDEDRERKAGSTRPGTYSVVVTPDSFAELPEYAAATATTTSSSLGGSTAITRSTSQPSRVDTSLTSSRRSSRIDPNIVVLSRFEDASPTSAAGPAKSPTRRSSLPDSMQQMSIVQTPIARSASYPYGDSGVSAGARLVTRFRQHIVSRLIPHVYDPITDSGPVPGTTKDIFEIESVRFTPLHHAMCALSALNLSHANQVPLEEAINHYDKALAAKTTFSAEDLLSDGMFFRHFLLFVYDLCMPVDADDTGADMWAKHLTHLQNIAVQRYARHASEPHAFLLWMICNLDMYACLMGNGNCDFVREIVRRNMLPPLTQQIPSSHPSMASIHWPNEAATFPAVLALNQGVVIHTAKLAQAAQSFRAEMASRPTTAPDVMARIQAQVSQLQGELLTVWSHSYPDFLEADSVQARRRLPPRVRAVFEHALILHHTSMIYSRTSMYPRQRLLPTANQNSIAADTEARVDAILSIAAEILAADQVDRRAVVFPIFIAGCSTTQPDAKVQSIGLIKAFEGAGIGHNSSVVRQLLVAVCEEQRRRALVGGRVEEVEWFTLARERGLSVINCGL